MTFPRPPPFFICTEDSEVLGATKGYHTPLKASGDSQSGGEHSHPFFPLCSRNNTTPGTHNSLKMHKLKRRETKPCWETGQKNRCWTLRRILKGDKETNYLEGAKEAKLLINFHLQSKPNTHRERLEITSISMICTTDVLTPNPEITLNCFSIFHVTRRKKTLHLKSERFFQRQVKYLIIEMTKDLAPNGVWLQQLLYYKEELPVQHLHCLSFCSVFPWKNHKPCK